MREAEDGERRRIRLANERSYEFGAYSRFARFPRRERREDERVRYDPSSARAETVRESIQPTEGEQTSATNAAAQRRRKPRTSIRVKRGAYSRHTIPSA